LKAQKQKYCFPYEDKMFSEIKKKQKCFSRDNRKIEMEEIQGKKGVLIGISQENNEIIVR